MKSFDNLSKLDTVCNSSKVEELVAVVWTLLEITLMD